MAFSWGKIITLSKVSESPYLAHLKQKQNKGLLRSFEMELINKKSSVLDDC